MGCSLAFLKGLVRHHSMQVWDKDPSVKKWCGVQGRVGLCARARTHVCPASAPTLTLARGCWSFRVKQAVTRQLQT